MAEQRDMSGVLSRNKKRENDRQPEFKGACTIAGTAYCRIRAMQDGEPNTATLHGGAIWRAPPPRGTSHDEAVLAERDL